jgi:hypothetical protein
VIGSIQPPPPKIELDQDEGVALILKPVDAAGSFILALPGQVPGVAAAYGRGKAAGGLPADGQRWYLAEARWVAGR